MGILGRNCGCPFCHPWLRWGTKIRMKIGVISDTHDRLPTFRRAVALFIRLKVDAVLHTGDYIAPFAAKLIAPGVLTAPLYCIYGNNDGEREGLKQVLPDLVDGPLHIQLNGKKIVMHHFIDWLKPADYADADIVVTGHSHHVVNEAKDGKLFVNPGECCGWVTNRSTVALVDLEQVEAKIIEVHD